MTPDYFTIIKMSHDGEVSHRIFSSFFGGYLYGDSWRCSTPIKSVKVATDYKNRKQLVVETKSGSTYELYENGYGLGGYAGSILSGMFDEASKSEGKMTVERLTEEESFAYLNSLTN